MDWPHPLGAGAGPVEPFLSGPRRSAISLAFCGKTGIKAPTSFS